jgi:hypothetical protein
MEILYHGVSLIYFTLLIHSVPNIQLMCYAGSNFHEEN